MGYDLSDQLNVTDKISSIFLVPPLSDHLHGKTVSLMTLLATIRPSSLNSNSSLDSLPAWLFEVHRELWGKHELSGQIFRAANLIEGDFKKLERRLHKLNPEMHP